MIAYLESSVLLRKLFRQKNALQNLKEFSILLSSNLTLLEAYRSIDRERIVSKLPEIALLAYMKDLHAFTERIHLVEMSPLIFKRASQPLPSVVSTLDSIHLITALLWKEHNQKEITFLTHDTQLGKAALFMGLTAKGF
ncbi:MAG: PIN domain-containing protein [Deltaproteobacteria bacterium]|nr:PIN domain-containing protein [Deltaproteobacteria bacterium]